jgi:hypothetical protein
MSKKKELMLVLAVISLLMFFLPSILAANSTVASGTFDKSYECLTNLANEKGAANMNVEELSLSLLALGYNGTMQAALKAELDKQKDSTNACWPKTGCTIKDTAQAMLAYIHIGQDTKDIENWLKNQTQATSELTWYLQLENLNSNITQCTLTYDGSDKKITIGADKVVLGSPGSCFGFGPNGYWLEVKSSCYGKEFNISCDADFLTSTIYSKKNTVVGPFFVTASSNIRSPDGLSTEKIDSICLKQGSSCTFEGSLWAALALDKKDSDFINRILPYLATLAPDNQRYLPSGFLLALTGFSEYYSDLNSIQDKKGYWQVAEASRRYYDTAIGLLSLSLESPDSTQALAAKTYFLEPSVQQANGCWNGNLKDVALILYAASPRAAASSGITPPVEECESSLHSSYKCMASMDCTDPALNGTVLSQYHCFVGSCCSKKPATLKSCSGMYGTPCTGGINQDCEGGIMDIASDTSFCCIDGNCVDKEDPLQDDCPTPNQCKSTCDAESGENAAIGDYLCIQGRVCCAPAETPEKPNYWWVLLLVILIILLVVAIIYRNQLKVWWFKVTSKFRKGPAPQQSRPGPGVPPGAMPRMMPGYGPRPPMPQRLFPKERELSETLGKLKRMSK